MRNIGSSTIRGLRVLVVTGLLLLAACPPLSARVIDNFDDNNKTGWTDFTFVPGFGLPTESGGAFTFLQPNAGQDIFSASQKVTENLELKEGRSIELRVDVTASGGEDNYAVLAFIPNTGGNSPGTLAGYGLAKDPTDVLITKGIQKYFVADDGPTAAIQNENITLVLNLTAKGGNVVITGKVIDRATGNVLWERTVTDTPGADVLADGTDSPAAPYLTTGYFTLYLYQQANAGVPAYTVTYDNAEYFIMDENVVDDFNDNSKTGWTDFTFVPGFGLPTESGGAFTFLQPNAGQDIFSASQKTTRAIDLVEGERVELRVDVAASNGEDNYAVLAFIPNTGGNSPGTLAGYGFAKDPTDVLITKGIQKYFVADDGATAEIQNENITLSLSLTVRGGNVIITARVFDRPTGNLLWEKTVVDTPGADVLADGTDSPAAPYITSGYFTLYLYQQANAGVPTYSLTYDNAILWAPPQAANTAPLIQNVQPAEFSNFLPATTQITFQATDDKPIADNQVSVTLNGTVYTSANGLVLGGAGANRTVTLGGLTANTDYTAVLRVTDAEGLATVRNLYFDTFATTNPMIEIEDYNYGGGQSINNPVPIAEGGSDPNSYSLQVGTAEIDFHETRGAPNGADTMYRPDDPIRMQRSRDFARAKYTAAGGTAAGVYDYDVGDIAADEWLNYTRNLPAGTYEVYIRQALANIANAESRLERVTTDPTQGNQSTTVIGSFLGTLSGFQYRNFPLTDGTGQKKVIVRINGPTTFRLHQVTPDPGDGSRLQNYLIFVPVPDPGIQRAGVASLSPANGTSTETAFPRIDAVIQNRDTSVKPATVRLRLNNQDVAATVTPTASGATVAYVVSPLPASGAVNNASLIFEDSDNVSITNDWSFVITYLSLDPANRALSAGKDRGMNIRMVQAPPGSALESSLARAEEQIRTNSSIPVLIQTNTVLQTMNMAQDDQNSGYFPGEDLVPGLELGSFDTDDFTVEAQTWLDLAAGVYRFGVVSDDGFKISAGSLPGSPSPILSFVNGGTTPGGGITFDVVVPAAGLYPFRFLWYERGGNAYAEWFSVNPTTGDRTLVNDPAAAGAIKAYATIQAVAAVPTLQSTPALGTGFTAESSATSDPVAKTLSVPVPGSPRFYRLADSSARRITRIEIQGANLVITYE